MNGEIQVDMFEVQLGASMLLQFRGETGTVRVLADAGIKASGYRPEHVLEKLRDLIPHDRRIDLMIGTHYDEDHLNGLVPIIEDQDTAIGEIWLPPVPNDTETRPLDQPLARADLLPHQLAGDDGEAVLRRYLHAKREDIAIFVLLERALGGEPDGYQLDVDAGHSADNSGDPLDVTFFRYQLHSSVTTSDPLDHGCDDELIPHPDVEAMVQELRHHRSWHPRFFDNLDEWLEMATRRPGGDLEGARQQKATLRNVRRTVAKEAINVTALFKVIDALRLHKKHVKIRTNWINDGTPRRYGWDPALKRFVKGVHTSSEPCFDLLGPSASLVEKHRDRLHPRDAAVVAFEFRREIRSITPSNQLSYIGCFRHRGQSILISGDAGCVDFSLARNQYYPALLDALHPLHVVQVAHHGGNNAHFYRVLAAANYTQDASVTYLLLSHATDDAHRPSDQFADFICDTVSAGGNAYALFTSEPSYEKVVDFMARIHAPGPETGRVGDIRLSFAGTWTVDLHAIKVP